MNTVVVTPSTSIQALAVSPSGGSDEILASSTAAIRPLTLS
jgi:hypothetical protein